MNELPPDAARLRAILEHLDRQAADNEAVGIYLRLQRDKVRKALAAAEEPPPRPAVRPALTNMPYTPGPKRFKIVHRAGGSDTSGSLHQGDCDIDEGPTKWLDTHEATAAMTAGIAGCAFCRPQDLLDRNAS